MTSGDYCNYCSCFWNIFLFQTHNFWKNGQNMTRAVLLLRNPFEVAITFRIFKLVGKTQTPKNMSNIFDGLDWKIHLMSVLVGWLQHSTKWVTSPLERLHVVYYERLVDNPKEGIYFELGLSF